jgi:hypothetical protein
MDPSAPWWCNRTGRILIGGLFTTVNGSNFNYIARLNSDGTTDTNFNVGVGCNNSVQAIALDSQLNILVGGSFTKASGVTRNGLTRLNPDGTVDPSINFGFGANGFVDAIVIQTNDEIDVAGGFSTFGNIPENNFARLYGGANAGNGSVEFSQQVYGVLESGTNAVIDLPAHRRHLRVALGQRGLLYLQQHGHQRQRLHWRDQHGDLPPG